MKSTFYVLRFVSSMLVSAATPYLYAQHHELSHHTEPVQPASSMAQHHAEHTSTTAHSTHEANHENAKHGGEAVHHPEPLNLLDLNRYAEEKTKAENKQTDAHGNPIVPVVPYGYMLINSALFFGILYYLLRKPIAQSLANRRQTIAKELDEAAKIKAEAQAKLDEYTQRLAALDLELEQIRRDVVASGEVERERIIREAEEKAVRMRHDAQFLLAQELKTLRNDLHAYTIEVACAAAETVLKSKVTSMDQERIANEYLHQLVASTSIRPPSSTQGSSQ